MPKSIKDGAVAATTHVQELVGKAMDALTVGFQAHGINQFGVYGDPSARRGDLRRARLAIEEALEILSNTPWPSQGDYEE